MVSSYPYRSLHFPDETRVLVIEPGQFTDPLTGKLHHVSVSPESSDSFDALSYCWTCSTETPPPEDKFEISPTATYDVQNAPNLPKGAPMEGTPHETICELLGRMLTIHCARYESLFYKYGMWPLPEDVLVLDGVEVNIGGELAAVLRRLRSTNEEIRIWVDAVCINQNDIGEKNEHVKIMGTIYSRASMVHVWLGEQYGGEESALETLVGVLKIFKEMAERTNGAMDENAEDFQRRFFEDERVRNLDFAELDELLQRSWVSAPVSCIHPYSQAVQVRPRLGNPRDCKGGCGYSSRRASEIRLGDVRLCNRVDADLSSLQLSDPIP